MKTRTIILLLFLGLGLVFVGVASLPLLMHRSHKPRIWPEHVLTLSEHPGALTEEIAITKARETLSLDGLNPDSWLLAINGCTISSNRAFVMFCTHGVADPCFVRVELDGSQMVCQTASIGKREK
jgi:hypothetical protein